MAKWLFGAEADKIQETLFRASRQRQVVGGSSLLYEFEKTASEIAKTEFGLSKDDLLVTAGGNFRMVFRNEQDAVKFGERLQDVYYHLLNAHITVAKPIQYADSEFKAKSKELAREIRRLKGAERGHISSPHSPTTAYCQSSGVGLATTFQERTFAEPNRKEYFSDFARTMELVGRQSNTLFLERVNSLRDLEWVWAQEADEIAKFDGERRNLAYLLADVNRMGKLFQECDEAQTRKISDALQDALFIATAKVMELLAAKLPKLKVERRAQSNQDKEKEVKEKDDEEKEKFVKPALPLILAGDDAFIMLPALYALDSAQQFCLEFERVFNTKLQAIFGERANELLEEKILPASISAALVICKGHYPYTLVYRCGHALLEGTKQISKAVAAEKNERVHSALAVHAIVGSEIVREQDSAKKFVASLSPYWLGEPKQLTPGQQEAGIALQTLLGQRLKFKDLPNKRRAEARALFAPSELPNDSRNVSAWKSKLEDLRKRIIATARDADAQDVKDFDAAFEQLGDPGGKANGYWREVKRSEHRDSKYHAHGLPDLIELWNYAQDLDCNLAEYQEGA